MKQSLQGKAEAHWARTSIQSRRTEGGAEQGPRAQSGELEARLLRKEAGTRGPGSAV